MRNFKGYTGIDTKSKILRDAQYMLEKSLDDPYSSTECSISPNGVTTSNYTTKIQVFPKHNSDGNVIRVVGRICDIERGNYLKFKNETWLIVNKPYDNGVFRKSEADACVTDFPVKLEDKKVQIGVDDLGRPVYEIIKGEIRMLPCVPKMNTASTAIADSNEPVNLLANQVMVTIPYTEAPSIELNEQFILYNETYRIIRIDPSSSINKIGILRITGEREGRIISSEEVSE